MQAVSQLVDSYALTLGYERTSDELWRVIDEVPLDCVFDTLSERLAAMLVRPRERRPTNETGTHALQYGRTAPIGQDE